MSSATDCPPSEELAALVAGESGPWAPALREHLDRCSTCQATVGVLAGTSNVDLVPYVEPELGLVVAERYRLERVLGRGGMATVYAATDLRLARLVALKILRPFAETERETRNKRLVAESHALARLRHPNVVQVFDAGIWRDDAYVAMELIDGQTLRAWAQGDHGWRERMRVLLAAGAGLQAVHDIDLVHRDFKPDNVFVDDEGSVYVGDFGLVRLPDQAEEDGASLESIERQPSVEEHERLTQTGALVGTPAYMAPEQLDGRPAGPGADVFAFCVTAWEVLFGVRPFSGSGFEERRATIEAQRFVPGDGRWRVPIAVRRHLMAGLAYAPSTRPAPLGRLLTRLRRSMHLRRVAVGSVAVVLTFGAGIASLDTAPEAQAIVCEGHDALEWDAVRETALRTALSETLSTTRANHAADALGNYTRRWHQAWDEACALPAERTLAAHACLRGQAATFETLLSVASTDPEGIETSTSSLPKVDRCTDQSRLLEYPLPSDPEERPTVASVWQRVEQIRTLQATGRWRQMTEQSNALIEDTEALEFAPARAGARWIHGVALARVDDAGAIEALRTAASEAMAAGAEVIAARCWIELTDHARDPLRDFERTAEYGRYAQAAIDRLDQRYDVRSMQARLLRILALSDHDQGQFEHAQERLEAALQLTEGYDDDATESALESLGVVVGSRGDTARAVDLSRAVLDHRQRTLAADHPWIGLAHLNLGASLYDANAHIEALAELHKALAILEDSAGSDHSSALETRLNIGAVLTTLGRDEEAVEMFEALEARLDDRTESKRIRVYSIRNRAQAMSRLGQRVRAVSVVREAGPIAEEQGKDSLDYIDYLRTVAALETVADMHAEALLTLDEIQRSLADKAELALTIDGEIRMLRGQALLGVGKAESAVTELEEGLRLALEHGDDWLTPQGRMHLSMALEAAGRRDDATAEAQRAAKLLATNDAFSADLALLRDWAKEHAIELD